MLGGGLSQCSIKHVISPLLSLIVRFVYRYVEQKLTAAYSKPSKHSRTIFPKKTKYVFRNEVSKLALVGISLTEQYLEAESVRCRFSFKVLNLSAHSNVIKAEWCPGGAVE
eukprot:1450105-Amphidinium_carterae.1